MVQTLSQKHFLDSVLSSPDYRKLLLNVTSNHLLI